MCFLTLPLPSLLCAYAISSLAPSHACHVGVLSEGNCESFCFVRCLLRRTFHNLRTKPSRLLTDFSLVAIDLGCKMQQSSLAWEHQSFFFLIGSFLRENMLWASGVSGVIDVPFCSFVCGKLLSPAVKFPPPTRQEVNAGLCRSVHMTKLLSVRVTSLMQELSQYMSPQRQAKTPAACSSWQGINCYDLRLFPVWTWHPVRGGSGWRCRGVVGRDGCGSQSHGACAEQE